MSLFADWYDLIYADKDYAGDIAAFSRLYGMFPPGGQKPLEDISMLEIGAGTGSHTKLLAPRVKELTAVEMADDFAAKAKEKITGLKNVKLQIGKMGKSAPSFDASAAFFHVLNYLQDEDALAAFAEALGSQLRPGAIFVTDIWHAEAVTADPPREETRIKQAEGFKIEQRIRPAVNGSQVRLDYDFTITPPGTPPPLMFQESLQLRLWPRSSLVQAFEKAGMRLQGCWDVRNFPAAASKESWRIWLVFSRNP